MPFIYFYLFILFVNPYLSQWWKIFPLAGREKWEALVPGYNYFVLYKFTLGKPYWSLLLIFPGVHLVMMMVANVTLLRRFEKYSFTDTLQGILFPYYLYWKISKENTSYGKETNWANTKEVEDRKWGDHIVLFLCIPVIGHLITTILDAISRDKPGEKSRVKEWGDSILFALIAAGIIRTYVFEPFQIPTGSMEKTLLVGDFLFVNKLAYGPKVPVTPLSHPLVHNNVPFINIPSYTTFEKGSYFRLPGFGDIERNDVVVFNYPSGDTAVFDPRMPNGLMGHDYHGIIINEAKRLFIDQFESEIYAIKSQLEKSKPGYVAQYYTMEARELLLQKYASRFIKEYPTWTAKARKSLAEDKVAWDGMENTLIEHFGLIYRPVDKRENYIKRCVALPGDFMEIKNAVLYINDQPSEIFEFQTFKYRVKMGDDFMLPSPADLQASYGLENDEQGHTRMDIEYREYMELGSNQESIPVREYVLNLTENEKQRLLEDFPGLKNRMTKVLDEKFDKAKLTDYQRIKNLDFFPKDLNIVNATTHFERIQIPFEGQVVTLTPKTIPYYRRIITAYEGHSLEERKDGYYIDGKKTTTYTVEMDYYWMMGDNRYGSADSRFWGFVPEDHIVGRASLVWFSKSPYKGVRWDRIFKLIE
jgi:signal peptidase I